MDDRNEHLQLELHEVAAWEDFYLSATDNAIRTIGIAVRRFGCAVATIAATVDVLAYNRVVGLALPGSDSSDAVIDAIIELYRSSGVRRFFVQVSPLVVDATLADRLLARGFRHHNNWVKLSRGVSPPPEARTDLRIDVIGPDQADDFSRLYVRSFGWPETLAPWVASPIGRSGWTHYLAYDEERPVATAAMYIRSKTAWIDFASTLPEARGRGAQSALLARRISDCADRGCTLVIVETAEPGDDKPAPSFRNVRRFGFDLAYARANYILELA